MFSIPAYKLSSTTLDWTDSIKYLFAVFLCCAEEIGIITEYQLLGHKTIHRGYYSYIGCSTIIIGASYFSFINTTYFNTVLINCIVYYIKPSNIAKPPCLFISSYNIN